MLSIEPTGIGRTCGGGWQGDMVLHAIVRNNNDRRIYFPPGTKIKDKNGNVVKKKLNISVIYKGVKIEKYIGIMMNQDTIPPHKSTELNVIIWRGINNQALLEISGKPEKLKLKDFKIKYDIDPSDFPMNYVCDSLTCIVYPKNVVYDE
jgi:hypothetical protein